MRMEMRTASVGGDRQAEEAWGRLCAEAVLADVVTDRVFVIDARFRILHANRAFLSAFGHATQDAVRRRTLGEVADCRHADGGGGCGGTADCAGCGWFQALGTSGREGGGEHECRILTRGGDALDFAITVRPSGAEAFRVCGMRDLFATKRLRVLERAFFHDVTNLAAGIRGLCEMIEDSASGQDEELRPLIHGSADKLVYEIERLRTLRVAENGDLLLCRRMVSPGEILLAVVERFTEEAATRHVEAVIEARAAPAAFETDKELLALALGELVRNAIEASTRGDRVTLTCEIVDGQIRFSVHNPAVLDGNVRAHVFERSFSTRGPGRGVGAYRARLIAERYLKGAVEFVSHASAGTTFSMRFPLTMSGQSV